MYGKYEVHTEETVMPSSSTQREMSRWRVYRKYHKDGSFSETLIRDSDMWRRIKIVVKLVWRKITR